MTVASSVELIPTWGNFNSLVQLSIGLNAAFATFSDFLGDGLSREDNHINKLIKRNDKIIESDPNNKEAQIDKKRLRFLSGECIENKVNHEKFRTGFVRFGGFACAFIGVIILIYSAYHDNAPIPLLGIIIIYLLLLPFILGAGHGMYISMKTSFDISKRRQNIERKIIDRIKSAAKENNESINLENVGRE